VPAAAFLGFALGYYPSRMECTPQTMGSGCYEGDLLYASVIFTVLFAPFFVAALNVALRHRKTSRQLANWWPLSVLSAVPITVIVLCLLSATANPNEYF
jgi:amino acid transporter